MIKLEQTVTWIEKGTFETIVTVTDEDGNVLDEATRVYTECGSFLPAYSSLINMLKHYRDETVEIKTNHTVVEKELREINEPTKTLAFKLLDLLRDNNLELIVVE